jgi:hypothetical protein
MAPHRSRTLDVQAGRHVRQQPFADDHIVRRRVVVQLLVPLLHAGNSAQSKAHVRNEAKGMQQVSTTNKVWVRASMKPPIALLRR